MVQQDPQEEYTLLDWFDQTLDDFHEWLNDIKDRREKEVKKIESEDIKQLTQELSNDTQEAAVKINTSSFRHFWTIWWLIALASYFFFQSLELFYLILTWLILSMASEKFIRFFSVWVPRGISIFITYILLLVFLFSWTILVIPFLIAQTAELTTLLIDWALVMQNILQQEWLNNIIQKSILPWSIKDNLISYLASSNIQQSIQGTLVENISQIVTMSSSYIKNAGDFAVWLLTKTFSALFQIAIVFTIAVFWSIEKKGVSKFIASWSSTPQHMEKTVSGLYNKLWDWLVGQLILCLVVWVLVGIWLMIMSRLWLWLPSSFTLALIAGLTEFIPYLWPILGWIPWILVASLAYWFKWFIAAGILYMIVQRVENNILVPLIMSQTLWVSPLVIFITMLLLWSLLGLLWVIIAVPVAVIINVVYKEMMKKKLVKSQ